MEQPIIVTCALLILGLAPKVSGMAKSVDQLAELRVTPTIQNTSQCYSSYFSRQLCFGDTTIEITDAVYGVSPCNTSSIHCCPDPGDCTIPVERKDPNEHPDYYNEILVKCNNKQICVDLQAQWINFISQWCTAANTDYVTLHYMCLTEADRPTTTATSTTVNRSSTTSSKPSPGYPVSTATATVVSTVTNVTDEDADGDGYNSTQTTLIIAVIVAMVVAVVVAVTVWMVCRKRKANSRSDENKKTVDDVDPYHTARPGGGPRDPGPPPAQGLNDVIKPAINPYDTGQPLAKAMVSKKPEPNPKAVDKPNIGADLYTEVVKVRPRKNVVLDKSPGEEDVEANNNGSDMTEAGDRASYDLVMQENHGYGTRQGLGGEGEGEGHGADGEVLTHEDRQDGDQDEQTDPDYDLVMTENNAYN